MKRVLVYQDYVHNNGVLLARLRQTFGADAISHIDAGDIIAGKLDETVALFVMPGGADLYYCEKLNGAGNAAIRRYVEAGGTYLGICAGAYYACNRIEWAKDEGADAVVGARELNFFQGVAVGPLTEYIEAFDKSWSGVATLQTADGVMAAALYRGGCLFTPDPGSAHVTLATYDLPGHPAAIVQTECGKGRVILSGCHIEHTPDAFRAETYAHRNLFSSWIATVAAEFSAQWSPATDLWSRLIAPLSKLS